MKNPLARPYNHDNNDDNKSQNIQSNSEADLDQIDNLNFE